jgi:hypothetical protein
VLLRSFSLLALEGIIETRWAAFALQTQQVVDAILRSSQNGGWVELLQES